MVRRLARLVADASSIVLLIHHEPDGDAIGSAAALYHSLTARGKSVTVVCSTSIAPIFRRVVGPLPITDQLPKADLYLLLDCAHLGRTGFSRPLQKLMKQSATVIALDHHRYGDWGKFAEHLWIDAKACATTELVFELLSELHEPITPSIATALLMGLYTDTGAFTHPNTSSRALSLAGRLTHYGADLALLSRTFSRKASNNHRQLWGEILTSVEMGPLGVVVARVSEQQFARTKSTAEDLNGLANVLALTEEASVALLLVETNDGYRGVLRTRHRHINLGRLARLLGGAGRPQAAGFTATK